MGKIDGIMKAVAATPWAILPDKLEAILDVLEMRAEGLRFTPDEIRARVGDGMRSAPKSSAQGSVAVLPLYGVIAPRMNMMTDVSGGTSAESFGLELDAALDNPQVSAVVIDADTPGGNTAGVPELAAKIREGKKKKPIYGVANHQAASAGYYLLAQCTEIIASPSALLGAVGVYTVHTDFSGADEKAGIKRTLISAGERKAAGMLGGLDDETRSEIQAVVDDTYAMMLKDIAIGRGVTKAHVEKNYGQGKVFSAQAALSAGLIDRVATLEDVLGELTSSSPPTRAKLKAITDLNLAAEQGGVFTSGTVPNGAIGWSLDQLTGTVTRADLVDGQQVITTLQLVPSAAPAAQPSPSAPKAKETPVSQDTTVATGATAAELETVRAALARSERIDEMCALVHASAADAAAFKASDKTPEQVREELMKRQKAPSPTPHATTMTDREAERPFASLGEQLGAIVAHAYGKGTDKRLLRIDAALSSGAGSANIPSDGAFQIQQDFSTDLTKDAFGEGTLAADCSKTEVSGTSDGLRVMYIDETSRATGSRWGGVQVYRGAEGDVATAKKPTFGEWERRVYDIIGAAKMSERLLDDTTAMASVLQESFGTEFAFVVDDEIVRGTGAGQCLGVLNSPALVTVAKETGQAADTVVAENITKMWSRLLPRAKATAKWYINQEIEQQLQYMMIGTGTSGQLVYMPPGGLTGSPFGTIYGRPVQIVEQCSAPGDVGDIILASLPGYKLITKGGLQSDDSIHVAFLAHERTFRWLTRVGGAPKLKSALTPYKGSNTLSDHVTLAAR